MRFGSLVLIILLGLGFSLTVQAQWDAQISQYWRTKTFFNPSFAGEKDSIQASVLHRMQWLGITHAPRTFVINADMPIQFLGRKHGVGVLVTTESIGLFKNMFVGGQYVFKKSWKKNTLNIGVQVGMLNIGFDASKIRIPEGMTDYDQDLPTAEAEGRTLDGGVGISWVTPKYYVGISSTHLLQPTFDLYDNAVADINRIYYFTAGYNLKFRRSKYEFQPSVLIKSDTKVTQYDVTARIVYNKVFNGGVTWRKDDGFVLLLGMNIYGFDVGYAYDLSTSEISKASSGSHEFVIRYTMPIRLNKKGQNSHKSVRIL
ncbi:PorP/SprF family type IX secretion system membrane protein [Dysgonomonas macrotermitis]|uniref:Type IX secretion system membrane protein, PorP/SprF family n=1 Tax=Dysgonomonas macrotermitis TaxID=1346286 RepID=A0A1M5CI27_9BACT|nr:type IX secretion system membrane protein PorP/SprF [Dysgonomonas macrotermitis]SHF54247.1 type IX secretion system membrane protein, PorP/SprF family [Dysgonomonas macrotermitis]